MEHIQGMNVVHEQSNETKGDRAKRLYPDMVVDCAVPQSIINALTDRGFDDPARDLVTVYCPHNSEAFVNDARMVDGIVMPISDKGIYMLAVLAQFS